MSRKVMITVAPTGGMAKKCQNPNLPTQPDEIADCVHRAYQAGAALAALHARRPDDQATCDAAVYRDVNQKIRAKCDIILNNSTGGGIDGDILVQREDGIYEAVFEERLKGIDGGAEMATFDGFVTSASFAGSEQLLLTTSGQCDQMAKRFAERGVKPEWEVFSHAHIVQDVTRLIKKGYDKPPYYINIVLGADRGFQGALPYSNDILSSMVALLPPQSIFCVSGIGSAQLPATTHALLLGGHVRVGLEDNLYYSPGRLAKNEELVERQVRIIRELGMEPATAAEAREILGLNASDPARPVPRMTH
ncbi:MAG TPA: 3-keto-5-aminohexanoate cleavage protein [Sphingomicrobium sp.]|nr:3-keto-5-aminohexanoate cleavage protein [Sphingomicrobium sp.]